MTAGLWKLTNYCLRSWIVSARLGNVWFTWRNALFIWLEPAKQREQAANSADFTSRIEAIATPKLPYFVTQTALSVMMCAWAEALLGRPANARRFMRRLKAAAPFAQLASECVSAVCRASGANSAGEELYSDFSALAAAGFVGISNLLRKVTEACLGRSRSRSDLTVAEIAVLNDLNHGRSPKEIADLSGRSVYTVQTHIQNAIRKLGCSGRSEALAVARRLNLLTGRPNVI